MGGHPAMPKRTGSTCLCAAAAALLLSTGAAADDGRPRDPALVAARSKVFGPENVDQRTGAVDNHLVIISWITNASFAASVQGRVVLLDTFVTRLEVFPGRTPFVIQDLVDLRPEALFLGHGRSEEHTSELQSQFHLVCRLL